MKRTPELPHDEQKLITYNNVRQVDFNKEVVEATTDDKKLKFLS